MSFTNIDDPSSHFQVATWTGNATARNITNDGNSDLQPDFIWMKCRDSNTAHIWQLSNLGVTKYFRSNVTSAIGTASSLISSFNSDGFGITSNSSNNVNSEQNVAWQWKCGANSTSSNTDGDITSTIQTNTTAGFTMGTYTGNGSDNQTIGHGLGAKPNWIIVKRKDTAAAWLVWHEDNSANHVLRFYTNPETDSASGRVSARASNSRGTSSIFTVFQGGGGYDNCNISGDEYIFWAWTEKQGYSKFGSYIGSGARDYAPFIYTGFQPAWLMVKNLEQDVGWAMFDNKRIIANGDMHYLAANTSGPESGTGFSHNDPVDFMSNGFRIMNADAWMNTVNKKYVFMAFAQHPFISSGGVPCTAR